MSYIPRSETGFQDWATNFTNYLAANLADLKFTAEELTALTQEQTDWQTAYQEHLASQSAAEAARKKKKNAHKAYESSLRAIAQRIRVDRDISEERKVALGINTGASTRKRISVPTTRPLGRLDASDRLLHSIYFVDEETPTRRGKPDGVMGCEVWVKLGDELPTDPSELQFLGLTTSAPYIARYGGDARGKTANYMLRWVNSRGEAGPWSQTFSAIVQA